MIVWEAWIGLPVGVAFSIALILFVFAVLSGEKDIWKFFLIFFAIGLFFVAPMLYSGYQGGGNVTATYDEVVVAEFEGVPVALSTTDLEVEVGDTVFVEETEEGELRITEFRRK